MTYAEQLAHALLGRMKEIDAGPGGDDRYVLLWDAILDEVNAFCPLVDVKGVLQPEPRTIVQVTPAPTDCDEGDYE
jgi:hypothetical protein